jgi:hypothetical protein
MLSTLPWLEISLEWPVASRYVVRDIELYGDHPRSHRAAIRIAEDATIAVRRPLEEHASLYAEFANLNGSEKACLDFAHKYGTLFLPEDARTRVSRSSPDLESFVNWKQEIKKVRDIIKRCELSRSNPAEAFRQFGKRDKWLVGVELVLSIKDSHSRAALETRVGTLIAGIQLQAVQSVLFEGRKSVQCIECNRPFLIGGGARRSQSKFCSTRCKDSFHNNLKAKARRTDHA